MKDAIIRTGFGEIRIPYGTTEELAAALEALDAQIKMISQAASQFTPTPPRPPKPGFERIYRFLSDGSLEILIFPSASVHKVVLVLWAYHPELVTIKALEKVTGIEDVGNRILWQKKNKKYFRNDGDAYGLIQPGLELVSKFKKELDRATQVQEE